MLGYSQTPPPPGTPAADRPTHLNTPPPLQTPNTFRTRLESWIRTGRPPCTGATIMPRYLQAQAMPCLDGLRHQSAALAHTSLLNQRLPLCTVGDT